MFSTNIPNLKILETLIIMYVNTAAYPDQEMQLYFNNRIHLFVNPNIISLYYDLK